MRITNVACACVLVCGLFGCSKNSGPVVATPEMEAEQKQAEQETRDSETRMRKQQKVTGKPTAEDEESARNRRGGR